MLKTMGSVFAAAMLFSALALGGCGGGGADELKAQNDALNKELTAAKQSIEQKDREIESLRQEVAQGAEVQSALRTRLKDAGLSENPAEGALNDCKENLKKIALGLRLYAADHGKKYPKNMSEISVNPNYLEFMPTCPAASKDTYSSGYKVSKDFKEFQVYCLGHYHANVHVKANYPEFSSKDGLAVEKEAVQEEDNFLPSEETPAADAKAAEKPAAEAKAAEKPAEEKKAPPAK